MSGPLLETKLHMPRLRRGRVQRPRLTALLADASESALTLVSAPAGFGKTTLLAEWLENQAGQAFRIAWVSLDTRDNDPVLFWSYVSTALKAATGTAGGGALSLLQEPRPAMDAVLATLVNELSALEEEVVLILDDYHLIAMREIHDNIEFFLGHRPVGVRVVMACRADPGLPLARMRGRGELTEIRSADLRFTTGEAAAYLNDVVGLALTPDDVEALESRTEGWIAALQLAGLSMQGRDDVTGFIEGFAGDDRYIVDYLAEEVLHRQPGDTHDFLLRTSILSRLSGPLCDAVTGRNDGKAMLAALERDNLFLLALDGRRQWFRYHQLFADVLQTHLLDEHAADVHDLHHRAAEWYEASGETSEAIRHALAAGDVGHAADLIERGIPALALARQDATMRRWLESLPEEVIRVRPVLSIAFAGSLMVVGEIEGVEARLRDAERYLGDSRHDPAGAAPANGNGMDTERPPEMVVADERAFRAAPGAIELYRAGLALILGDVDATISHAQRSLDLAAPDDHIAHGPPAGLLGLAYWTRGDLDAAGRWYAYAIDNLGRAGHVSDVLGCTIAATDIMLARGRLREARATYERVLRRARDSPATPVRGMPDMQVGIAELLRENNDLDAARSRLAASTALGEHAALPQNRYRWRVTMARILEAEGDRRSAIDLLDEAELVYTGDFSPDVRPVAAVRAAMWARHGEVGKALDWAHARGLTADDELSYLHAFEHLTLARVLLAQHLAGQSASALTDALRLLERLLRAAELGRRPGGILETLVVQVLARQLAGDQPAALTALHRALADAEPEGYVRTFVDEGPPMAAALRAFVAQRPSTDYARRLLAVMEASADGPTAGDRDGPDARAADEGLGMTGATARRASTSDPRLIEALSDRELDVLRLLATDLDGPDIARRLVISLNTVRTHTKHIYSKLGVNNRRAAVSLAIERQLLSPSGR